VHGGESLEKDLHFFICFSEVKLEILHPVAELKDQAMKDSQAKNFKVEITLTLTLILK
jgi:hypothetical protein